jgi:LDH2 family malate/lactate/ureidoglycolate dehydrogenase
MSADEKYLTVPAEELRPFVARLLEAAGASRPNAEVAARMLVEADLRGVGIQGVDYAYMLLDSLKRGIIDGKAESTIVHETAATVLIDGNGGLGQPAALRAVDVAVKKARDAGAAVVAIRNSTDIFMIGLYAELIARQDLVAFVTTSGPPLVHPHGGTERLLSTNPIAFAFPRAEHPFVFDMATTQIASSRVRQAAYYGEPVPPGSGIGPDGFPTTEAAAIRKGALSPLGGHKGFGLALAVALLCGPLTGSGIGPELSGWQHEGETETQGHLMIAIDPAAFGDSSEFLARCEWYLNLIKRSKVADGADGIRIPGERAGMELARQSAEGIKVLARTWSILEQNASEYGVQVPSCGEQGSRAATER